MIYTGTKSLMVLRAFIDGFVAREMEINPCYRTDFWDFNKLVADYYKDNINMNWNCIITAHTKNDEESFSMFFWLLDKFLDREKN